jgi:outer membrane protein assembly factor BamB
MSPTLTASALLLSASAVFAQSKPADWPQWRGGDRTAVSPETGLLKEWPEGGPRLLWTATGMGRGFGSVAVSKGRVYALGDARNRQQAVVCVNAADGKVLWSAPVGKGDGARNTPTVDGELLYCLNTQGNQHAEIVCLKSADGKEVWRKDFQKDFGGRMMSGWGYSESPLVDGDKVICTPGGSEATLVALNKKTGAVIWKASVPDGDAAGYASIVPSEGGGVRQYIMLLERGIVGVAAKDGKFLWRYNRIANRTANIPTALVRGDLVFCSTGYNTGAALLQLSADGAGVKAQEKYFLRGNTFQNHHGGMVLIGDHVYAGHGHNNGFPICVELTTGKVVWGGNERGVGTGSAAICAADGMLYFRYESAVMALIEATPAGYRLKGRFDIPGGAKPSWQHPVVSGGRLYLRDQDRLLCYDVKAK